ncbi:MAG: BCD family MFS transporter [Beijerinckiaceae bacterium]|nr:BCD family MFS transporter [Beijerinckiaceae bacterium]
MSIAPATGLTWFQIIRIGLVQTAIGAIVVLTTSTLNRVMVIEIGLPALVPGLLVTVHYAVQILRPRWGHGSDGGLRRTPWIIGGMAVLASGGALAALATAIMHTQLAFGLSLGILAFLMIGIGVGAAGTSLLTLLAERSDPARRAPAATIVWIMMIAGFAITAVSAGKALDPFSPERLVWVTSIVSVIAFTISTAAILGIEKGQPRPQAQATKPAFATAMREVWSEPQTRRFTIFVFVSMLAYNSQDLILEPFAGVVFGMTPGESTQLGGMQHGGVLVGMIAMALMAWRAGRRSEEAERALLRSGMINGCLASALAMAAVAMGGVVGPGWPIKPAVFALGAANGFFAIAAISSMMALARQGHASREGVRMGLWGAAQAIAFALGGLLGTLAVDVARVALGSPVPAYTIVFFGEALAFVLAAALGAAVSKQSACLMQQATAQ